LQTNVVRARSKVIFFIGISVSFCPIIPLLRRFPEKVAGKVEEVFGAAVASRGGHG